MELRSPDPALNPYLAFALIIAAGLDGIENGMKLPPAVDADLYSAGKDIVGRLYALPNSLEEAVLLAKGSAFAAGVLGEELVLRFCAAKTSEAAEYAASKDKAAFYAERYFGVL